MEAVERSLMDLASPMSGLGGGRVVVYYSRPHPETDWVEVERLWDEMWRDVDTGLTDRPLILPTVAFIRALGDDYAQRLFACAAGECEECECDG